MKAPMPRSRTPEPHRRPWSSAITAVLALSGTVVALMQVTATLLSSAVATPIVSRSADMYGKRKMMVVCLR